MKIEEFIKEWKDTYTERIRLESKSKKTVFEFKDTLKYKNLRTGFDTVLIEYLEFMNKKPLQQNDYFKYVNAYRKTGKRLNLRFFRHDKKKLAQYYSKIDDAKLFEEYYNPFNYNGYARYVLYMMLKLKGQYIPSEHDDLFKVRPVDSRTDYKPDNRETNPCTSTASVLRGFLPYDIKEYDISRAYPTFIFKELGIKPFDVYSKIDKIKFNSLLNTHSGNKGATIEGIRAKLEPIFGDRVNDVITERRFNTSGGLYYELTKIEREYIEKFVEANKLTNYVRLHDGVVMLADVKCDTLVLDDIVEFKTKNFSLPTSELIPVNFYRLYYNEVLEKMLPETTPVTYKNFFEQERFIRVTRDEHDAITILKTSNKIVETLNYKTDLASYLKESINEEEEVEEEVENQLAMDTEKKIKQGLMLLTPQQLTYHRDTSDTVDISFKNGIARIKEDGMELISYDDVEGFFAKHKTQDHNISFIKGNEAIKNPFAQFLISAATGKDPKKEELNDEDRDILGAFFSMMGFYISNYKEGSSNISAILTDHDADGINRNGGRGKSLVQESLTHIIPSLIKGGEDYNFNYTHLHADVRKEHDLYILDDIPLNFNLPKMYTSISNGVNVQHKGKVSEWIPFDMSPKFLLSYNGSLRFDPKDTSTIRRFKEYKFTSFWQGKNPGAYYGGGDFFDTWNDAEWNDFYNFGFFCVRYFLKNGLQTIEYDKREDNFKAYFSNDVVEDETKRLFKHFEDRDADSFSAREFIDVHKRNYQYEKPIFHQNNASKLINIYIEHRELPYKYDKHNTKRWVKTGFRKVVKNDGWVEFLNDEAVKAPMKVA